MLKAFLKNNFFVLFAVFFTLPMFFLISDVILNRGYNYQNILKYGIETDGYIVDGSEITHTSVNEVSYYSIEYYFYDENMVAHIGRTSESYTSYDIYRIIENETIKIKYIPDTFESIESSYKPAADKGRNLTIIFLVVFGIVDVVLWSVVIYVGRKNIQMLLIDKNGQEYSAKVTSISFAVIENDVKKYKVEYTWYDNKGNNISDSSRAIYSHKEARALEVAKDIKIKAIGNKSIIISEPDLSLLKGLSHKMSTQTEKNHEEDSRQESSTCRYCGEKISKDAQYCGNCGAKIIKYDQK